MKVSKHLHSCLLVEDDAGPVALLDPGNYTLEESALPVDELSRLDFVLITHEHQDHMSVPLIKKHEQDIEFRGLETGESIDIIHS